MVAQPVCIDVDDLAAPRNLPRSLGPSMQRTAGVSGIHSKTAEGNTCIARSARLGALTHSYYHVVAVTGRPDVALSRERADLLFPIVNRQRVPAGTL
jgi:hypothetical protein